MRILAINTSEAACDIAVTERGELVAAAREEMRRGQDARLPGLVREVLADAGMTLADLDRFAVVTGPGSFTGIRIGVAFARGLALATKADCVGLTSLEASCPLDDTAEAIYALAAQTRPPDKTWWVQTLKAGMAAGPVMERPDAEVDWTRTRIAEPSAVLAALRAAHVSRENHPPAPVYARAPDARRA